MAKKYYIINDVGDRVEVSREEWVRRWKETEYYVARLGGKVPGRTKRWRIPWAKGRYEFKVNSEVGPVKFDFEIEDW